MTKLLAQVLFCDDIRREVGGKISLIGVLRNGITLERNPPVRLPKLAVIPILSIIGPTAGTTVEIVGRVSWSDSEEPTFTATFIVHESDVDGLSEDGQLQVIGDIVMPGFPARDNGELIVTARLNDEPEIPIGALEFTFQQPD